MARVGVSNDKRPPIVLVKMGLWLLCLAPLARLLYFAWHDVNRGSLWLSANPVEFVTRDTGTWALVALMLTLLITPLRKIINWPALIRVRRLLGLFAFFYACLHLTTYVWLDQAFDWAHIGKDILKRPFITVGFAAWLTLLPLALTSTQAVMRKMGGKRWMLLHRLAYVAPLFGVIHYWWLVKADISKPLLFATAWGSLMLWRAVARWQKSPTPRKHPA